MSTLNPFPFKTTKEKQSWYEDLYASVKDSNAMHHAVYAEGQLSWHKGLCPDECPYLDIAKGALQSNSLNIIS